jgi:hypothetical protein
MLVELGVLTPKDEDFSHHIATKLRQLAELKIGPASTDLADWLKRSGRRDGTIFNNLCYIHQYFQWGNQVYPRLDLLMVHESKILEFVGYLAVQGYKPSQQRNHLQVLRRFFFPGFATSKKLTQTLVKKFKPTKYMPKLVL